jgi:predicted ATP-grasp superfamily ATP-dependent carboligase
MVGRRSFHSLVPPYKPPTVDYEPEMSSLLILGASARAAAQAAARLGLRTYCGDLFCDADLPDNAVGQVARRFPRDLLEIAERSPTGPWLYTGGLENYPGIVTRISRRHELLGTLPEELRRVRDPFGLQALLGRAGLLFPETRRFDAGMPLEGRWLVKHRRSSGGLKVHVWSKQSLPGRGWYSQRRVEGLPVGALYVAASGRASLLGVSEQILTRVGSRPFQYAGSIGPIELSPTQHQAVVEVGNLLAKEFDLRGLFGVDLVLAANGVWVIEVNPRYTASVEVLERAIGFNPIDVQFAACRQQRLPDGERRAARLVGKLVVYADRAQTITAETVEALLDWNRGQAWPVVADVPRAGTTVELGRPLLTVFAEADDAANVRRELRATSNRLAGS